MITRWVCGLALSLGCGAVAPAVAKECGPLKMLASVKLIPQPGYRQAIPVTINGSPKQFILDTGGIHTQINPAAANDLHLTPASGATPIFDASGTPSDSFTKIDSFEFGGMTAKDLYLRISPSNLGADGLIAPDILNSYDIEMDFAGQKMNYFLPDHCPGKVVYWPHNGVARVSIVLADKRWIKVPVELDGKSLLAIIDTGATSTVISTKTAQEVFGLTPDSPGMEQAGNVNGDANLASHSRIFSSLTLDGIAIKNLRVVIMPDRMTDANAPRWSQYWLGGALVTQKRMEMPDLILGMDVLKHLRLYFAFEEHNLYATAAQVSPLPADAAPVQMPKLSPPVMAALLQAQEAYTKKDYAAALAAVSKARAVPELSPFDVFMIHRFSLSIHVALKDLAAAAVAAEAAADTDPSVIPEADRAMVYKAALQLSLNAGHFDKAAGYARLYEATNPPASDQALISAALSHAANGAEANSKSPSR